ncbi:hypothetical protein [Gordonia sp. (in: high G+C Gram-positive bacteria)]|uniref:hypothetical protein n=1 Tax=Gordonia sp. (in: high G+C Gram-positive bacteria) TaxID=84139 RepID=UPI0033413372
MTTPTEARPSPSRIRAALAFVLIAAGLILAPVATIGSWAHSHLVDTEHFVSTFAPLADDVAVQDFVADQIVAQVESQVDVPGLVGGLFTGASNNGAPPALQSALDALQGPAVAGVRSLMSSTAERLVRSSEFSKLWESSLRLSHRHVTAVLDADPDHAVQLSDGGDLTLRLEPFVESLRSILIDRGLTFLDRVDVQVQPVVLVQSGDLGTARLVYRDAVVAGYWLPWVSLGLLAAGVLVANRRRRALSMTAAVFAVLFVALAITIHWAGLAFADAISPTYALAAVADVVFVQLTVLVSTTVRVLAILGVLVAVSAWFHGPSRFATALRTVVGSGFARVRAALDQNGGDTGAFGRLIDRFRSVIVGGATAFGLVLLVVLLRPVTMDSVGWLFVSLACLSVALELVRRPSAGEVE